MGSQTPAPSNLFKLIYPLKILNHVSLEVKKKKKSFLIINFRLFEIIIDSFCWLDRKSAGNANYSK